MKPTAAQRVLAALKAAGKRGCTTAELCAPEVGGVRFGGRIMELRNQGHAIESFYVRRGSHKYVLTLEVPAVTSPRQGNGSDSRNLGGDADDTQQRSAGGAQVDRAHRSSGRVGAASAAQSGPQAALETPETPAEAAEKPVLFADDEFKRRPKHDQVDEAA